MDFDKPRRFFVILLTLFLAIPCLALSQKKTERAQVLFLPARTIRLDSLGDYIARTSGFFLSFSTDKINPGKKIAFNGASMKLDDLLTYLDDQYQITSEIMGNHIILFRDNSSRRAVQSEKAKSELRASTRKSGAPGDVPAAGPENVPEPSVTAVRPVVRYEIQAIAMSVRSGREGEKLVRQADTLPAGASRLPSFSREIPASVFKGEKKKSRSDNGFYLSAGLTANEVFYANPGIRAGLPWLFATAAWKTNFKASGFFYGMGSAVPLSKNWDISFSLSTGTLSKDFSWPFSNPDSTHLSDSTLHLKSRPISLGLFAARQINDRWSFEFGPVINFMRSSYALSGIDPVGSSLPSGPPGTDPYKEYYLIRPPYSLGASYDEKRGSGKKIWIGFQLGVFYRLRY
ncbi:hypothetical protein [Compostibacter hankyongensis]|uniref:hypothetical protein n=1 Tax=Compostibacter hankyongensis TaxID=1007089 RepID=UPI0031EFF321